MHKKLVTQFVIRKQEKTTTRQNIHLVFNVRAKFFSCTKTVNFDA